MTTSELMKAMSDAGAPFEAILIAVQAIDAKDAEIAARDAEQAEKRARDAERKREERAARGPYRRRPRTFRGRSEDCPPDPPIDNHTPPVSSNDEIRAKPKRKAADTPAKPDDVSDDVWAAFKRLRAKKGGLSDIALAGIRREAVKAGWTLEAALTRCIEKNWQGFEASWVAGQPAANDGGGFLAHLKAKKARDGP